MIKVGLQYREDWSINYLHKLTKCHDEISGYKFTRKVIYLNEMIVFWNEIIKAVLQCNKSYVYSFFWEISITIKKTTNLRKLPPYNDLITVCIYI